MTQLLVPSGVAYVLAALGLLALLWRRSRRLSAWLFATSALTVLVFSVGFVATAVISPLEYAFPTVHSAAGHPNVRTIVVLTGYAANDLEMPLTGRLHWSSAQRVTMTLQLRKTCPACRVIVSGGESTARIMREVLVELGVPPADVTVEGQSLNTAHSAANLGAMLQGVPFFLVTSAGHMTRSVGVMRKAGLDPIPAPTDHTGPRDWRAAPWRPTAESLLISDLAIHEYVGCLWYRLRGWI